MAGISEVRNGHKEIELENFTVFDKMDIQFTEGINVLIGENGVGKTHVMKLAVQCVSGGEA